MLKKHSALFEFIRYAMVGGVAAAVDMAVNTAMLFWVLGATKDDGWQIVLSVAVGFLFGLICNYILSDLFVFSSPAQRKKGRTLRAFLIYAAVGVVGLLLAEVLTLLGSHLIPHGEIWYLILSAMVKGVVLIWNYAGRKIFVYRGN